MVQERLVLMRSRCDRIAQGEPVMAFSWRTRGVFPLCIHVALCRPSHPKHFFAVVLALISTATHPKPYSPCMHLPMHPPIPSPPLPPQVHIPRPSPDAPAVPGLGKVLIEFAEPSAAIAARNAMHGRCQRPHRGGHAAHRRRLQADEVGLTMSGCTSAGMLPLLTLVQPLFLGGEV